jgi:hypothetical protein
MSYSKKVLRSMYAHERCYGKIGKKMLEKNGFFKKGEWERLERKRIYHNACVHKMSDTNRLLTRQEKKNIFNNIKLKIYK